jgi:FtsZ-binding cell division protein ZapB
MEIVDSLSKKVFEAARRIKALQDERARLLNEIDHLKLQAQRQQELARENDSLKRNQEAVRSRLQRLQKKLDKQLVLDMNIPALTAPETEASYEEPVQ